MMMKKTVCLLCAVGILLLGGCGARAEYSNAVGEEIGTGVGTEQGSAASDARLAYYEQLVNELQQELLAMKAELYSAKAEYEARIEELEATEAAVQPTLPFTYVVDAEGVTVTAYRGSEVNVSIPATIDGKAVVAIGDKAFLNNQTIRSVVIPEGVRTVGWFAFSGCAFLGAISVPASVESICYGAFENCSSALTVFCPKDSYAQKYAQSYGISTAG